jgi:hypothetical protein
MDGRWGTIGCSCALVYRPGAKIADMTVNMYIIDGSIAALTEFAMSKVPKVPNEPKDGK